MANTACRPVDVCHIAATMDQTTVASKGVHSVLFVLRGPGVLCAAGCRSTAHTRVATARWHNNRYAVGFSAV